METINFEVKLFDTTSLAADGSNIPRSSCEEYLKSDNYANSIASRTAMGGISHKDRRLRPELKGLIGVDDQVLIEDNALFYITALYFKPGDDFLYASAETFDPDLFAGKRRDNIINLMGLLQSGVKPPVSVVIHALWSKRNVAEKIIKIKGFDITQNPSFKGAGDLKIFSEIVKDEVVEGEETRGYSKDDYDSQIRIFSFDSEINVIGQKTFSDDTEDCLFSKLFEENQDKITFTYSDIVSDYGQGSQQEKLVRNYQGKIIPKDDIKKLMATTVDPKSEDILERLQKYTEDGDQDVLQKVYRGNRDKLARILTSVPDDDPHHDELIKIRLSNFFRVVPKDVSDDDTNRTYSLDPNTIADRVRTASQPRYTKLSRILRTYKSYWETGKLDDKKKLDVKILLLQDINMLIKEVLPLIYKGQTFNSLYGLSQYGDAVRSTGITLSRTYRKVLISERMLKFIPKGLYAEWSLDIRNFYDAILTYTFGETLPRLEVYLIDTIK